jgi:hypothetical protein
MRNVAKRMRHRSEILEPAATDNPPASEPQNPESATVADSPAAKETAATPSRTAKLKTAPKVGMWDYLDDDLRNSDATTVTIYRLEPIINKTHGQHYIAKKSGRITPQDILEEFGTGVYDIYVKDAGKNLLYRDQLSIHNSAYPPKVDPSEIIATDPRNAIYLKVWGKQSANGSDKDSTSASDMNTVLNTVLEKASSFDPKLAALWERTAEQRDELSKNLAEKSAPADLAGQLKVIKELFPQMFQSAPAPPPSDLLAILTQVKELQGDPFSALEKLKSFLPKTAEPKPETTTNPVSQIKEILQLVGEAKQLFQPEPSVPAGAATSPDDGLLERILMSLVNQASPLASIVPSIIAAIRNPPVTHPTPGAPTPAPPGAFNPYDAKAMQFYVQAQRAAASAPPSTASPTPTQTAGAPAQATGEQPGTENAIVAHVGALINQALNCLNRGIDGRRAAASFIDLNGDLSYDSISSQIKTAGAPMVVQTAKGIPELRTQVLAFEGPLMNFIAEFAEGPDWGDEQEANAACA